MVILEQAVLFLDSAKNGFVLFWFGSHCMIVPDVQYEVVNYNVLYCIRHRQPSIQCVSIAAMESLWLESKIQYALSHFLLQVL